MGSRSPPAPKLSYSSSIGRPAVARLGDGWRDIALDRAGALHGIFRRFGRIAAEG